jgi:Ni,Fe-hydrogenase maturation factor
LTTLIERPPIIQRPAPAAAPGRETEVRPILVEVLACGLRGQGDDGAAIAALEELEPELPVDVMVRRVGQLDIDDLLAVPTGAGAVVVDTATGLDPGWVAEIALTAIANPDLEIRTRSSNALARPETLGLATMIRGLPLSGIIVVIGGRSWRPGDPLSWPVASGICTFRVAIADAIDRVRLQVASDAPHG